MEPVHTNQNFHVYKNTQEPDITVSGEFSVQNQKEGLYALASIHFLRSVSKMNFGQNDPNAGTPPPILLFNAYGPFLFNNLPVIVKSVTFDFSSEVDYVQVNITGQNNVTSTIPGVPGTPDLPLLDGRRDNGSYTPIIPGKPAIPSKQVTQNKPWVVWLPSMFKLSISISPQFTPNTLRTRFNLPSYINGVYNSGGPTNQGDFI